jgi:GDP-L-fucose synthase
MISPMRSSSCSGTETINVGVDRDVTIAELASVVAGVVGFKGEIEFDTSRPDGTPRKLLDVSRLTALGWQAHTGLKEGVTSTINGSITNAPTATDQGVFQRTEHGD